MELDGDQAGVEGTVEFVPGGLRLMGIGDGVAEQASGWLVSEAPGRCLIGGADG